MLNNLLMLTLAGALILAPGETAWASEAGHSLPWGDFLLRVLNAAIFLWILWRVAGKLVKKFFADRRTAIVSEMDDLAQRKQDAEAKLADVERRVADVEAECARLLEEGRAQAERMKASIIEEAEARAVRIIETAKRTAETEGKAELEAIRLRMSDLIVSKLEEQLAEKLDAGIHQKLIDKSVAKVVLQ